MFFKKKLKNYSFYSLIELYRDGIKYNTYDYPFVPEYSQYEVRYYLIDCMDSTFSSENDDLPENELSNYDLLILFENKIKKNFYDPCDAIEDIELEEEEIVEKIKQRIFKHD